MHWRSTISMTVRDACSITGLVPEDVTALVASAQLEVVTLNGKVFVVTRSLLRLVEGDSGATTGGIKLGASEESALERLGL